MLDVKVSFAFRLKIRCCISSQVCIFNVLLDGQVLFTLRESLLITSHNSDKSIQFCSGLSLYKLAVYVYGCIKVPFNFTFSLYVNPIFLKVCVFGRSKHATNPLALSRSNSFLLAKKRYSREPKQPIKNCKNKQRKQFKMCVCEWK